MTYTEIVKNLYEYECNSNMRVEERLTYYSEALDIPLVKEGVEPGEVRKRYEHFVASCKEDDGQESPRDEELEEELPRDEEIASEEKTPRDEELLDEQDNSGIDNQDAFIVQRIKKLSISESKLLIQKGFKNGRWDSSTYSVRNLSNGIAAYLALKGSKRIGYKVGNIEVFVCIKGEEDENSSLLNIDENELEGTEFFYNYYKNTLWPSLIQREEEIRLEQQLAEEARLREENLRISPEYGKHLKKVLVTRKYLVVENEELRGFDFRTLLQPGMIFVHCDLTAANLTDCNVEGVIFYDCILDSIDITGCDFEKALVLKSPRDEEMKGDNKYGVHKQKD